MITQPSSTSIRDKNTPSNPETYSIIVADDDRPLGELLATNLRRLGHRVIGVAWNGRQAVDLVLKNRPEVLIMDLQMPVLDGLQAAREILAQIQLPIVMSTGVSDSKQLDRAADLNLVSYIVKPYSPAQLKVAIHLAVAQSRAIAQRAATAAAA